MLNEIILGVSEIPRNIPSMLIEVIGLGVAFALISSWLSSIGTKRRLAKELSYQLDRLLHAIRDIAEALIQDGDVESYKTRAKEVKKLHKIMVVEIDRTLAVLDNNEKDRITEFANHLEVLKDQTTYINPDGVTEEDIILEHFRSKVFDAFRDNPHAISGMLSAYDKSINTLWGFTLFLRFPRKLKRSKRQYRQLEDILQSGRTESSKKFDFSKIKPSRPVLSITSQYEHSET